MEKLRVFLEKWGLSLFVIGALLLFLVFSICAVYTSVVYASFLTEVTTEFLLGNWGNVYEGFGCL